MLRAALAELGQPVDHTVCLRRAAVETALADVEVTVPVRRRLELFYPLHPTAAIEDGAKRITFEPPAETLRGERIHQWLGAAWGTRGRDWDLFRIARQQILVRRLLEGEPTVLGLDRPMAEVFEQAHEQPPIERRVVDHQDPPAAPVDAPSPDGAAMSDAWSASGAIGFAM